MTATRTRFASALRKPIRFAKPSLLGRDASKAWVELVRAGKYLGYHGGPMEISLAALDEMVRNFKDSSASNQPPVTIGHPKPDAEIAAVGWIVDLKVDGATLMGLVEFAQDFAKRIKKGAFRYVSIEASLDALHPNTGKPIGATLDALAVTNRPFVRGLAPISLSSIPGATSGERLYLSQKDFPSMTPEQIAEALKSATPEQLKSIEEVLSGSAEATAEASAEGTDAVKAGTEASSEVKAEDAPATEEAPASEEGASEPQAQLDGLLAGIASLLKSEGFASPEEALAALQECIEGAESEEVPEGELAATATPAPGALPAPTKFSQNKSELAALKAKLAVYEAKELESTVSAHIASGVIHLSQKAWAMDLAKSNPKSFDSFIAGAKANPAIRLSRVVKTTTVSTETTPMSEWQKQNRKAMGLKD